LEAIIRPARRGDAEALQRNCYPEHALEDVENYLSWCLRQAEKGRIVRLVAEVAGQAVGNAQLTVWGWEGEIGSLVVAGEYRRQGLASQLLTRLVAEARQRELIDLEISVCGCQPAILAFYERMGFQRVVQSRDCSQDGSNAVSARGGEIKSGLSHPVRPGPVVQCRMLLQGR
jgi:ribosomal protein S18 acetylase RimI-like enzyme